MGSGWVRRILSVTEISSMERQALVANVYEWDAKTDLIKRTEVPMRLIEVLASKILKTEKDVEMEIFVRKKILEWMAANGVHTLKEVELMVQQYYYNPDSLLRKVLAENQQTSP